ncbi:MAG: ROK family protein [Anaerolineae bacterium]|nr:ROK family protein [Anaerolineae bacterium]
MEILGIDIGGSGIKGAPVDIETGTLQAERLRLDTPQPSVPEAVGDTVAEIVRRFNWQGPIGCTFPAVVKHGVTLTAANVDKAWLNFNGQKLFEAKTGCPVLLLNDADAAGIAEMEFGAGKGEAGVVIMLTFGTGIGSAIFVDSRLVPNTEFGHMEVRGKDAEHRAADRIRTEKDLSWEKWAERVNEFLGRMEALFSPDLFIIGGGVSKKHEKFLPFLKTQARIVPAQMLNEAGIIGAAMAAKVLVR